MRPGSSAGLGGPGLAYRPGTGQQQQQPARLGTAGLRPGTASTLAGSGLSFAERPITQQGLLGVRPATGGPGRQVQDASFFLGLLRSRTHDIVAETGRLRGETERAARDAAAITSFERQYEGLIKEVRSLEGDLADYNLALDKARTHTETADVAAVAAAQKRRNEAASREADAMFVERAERERGAAKLEEAVADLQRAASERINSLPPDAIAEYRALVEENAGLETAIEAAQRELEALNAGIEAAEGDVRRDRVRDDYVQHEKRVRRGGGGESERVYAMSFSHQQIATVELSRQLHGFYYACTGYMNN